jgi:hypothetical protein
LCAAPNVPEESTKFSKLAICTAYWICGNRIHEFNQRKWVRETHTKFILVVHSNWWDIPKRDSSLLATMLIEERSWMLRNPHKFAKVLHQWMQKKADCEIKVCVYGSLEAAAASVTLYFLQEGDYCSRTCQDFFLGRKEGGGGRQKSLQIYASDSAWNINLQNHCLLQLQWRGTR